MTQGELLSAFAPIDTFIQICYEREERIDEYLTTNDINLMMPFVTNAKEAAEKLSSFALEHSKSKDENKRNLSKLIRNKFVFIQSSLLYDTLLGREHATIAWLNNSIKSVNSVIDNTIEILDALEEIPGDKDTQIEDLQKEISMLKQQNANRKSEENEKLRMVNDQLVRENGDQKKKIETLMMQHESQRLKTEGLEEENAKKLLLINQLNSEIETLKAALLESRQYARQNPNTEASESGKTEWIACFDGFLHSSLNPQAIANALHNITHSYFSKNEKAYWWVFYTVLTEIHWIPKKDYKLALQWANLHFNCGWDWRKDHQFRFSDINDKIKAAPSSKWNKALTGNVIGDYYGELAKTMKETFVFIVNGGKLRDNDKYIIPGSPLINTGR